MTELLTKALARLIRCRVRQVKLKSGKTKTFAPGLGPDADPPDAVAALTNSADSLAPRMLMLEQGTHCE